MPCKTGKGRAYTHRAQFAVGMAMGRRGNKDCDIISIEMLLLEISRSDTIAGTFLNSVGFNLAIIVTSFGLPSRQITPFDPSKAEVWASKFDHNEIGTEHLLLAILEQGEENTKSGVHGNTPTVFKVLSEAQITTQVFMERTGWSDLIRTI